MSNTTWEKTPELAQTLRPRSNQRLIYLVAGIALIAVVGYLVVSGVIGGGRYFMTIDELLADEANVGKNVRVSGAVVGDYEFDQDTQTLTFIIANITNDSDEIRDAGGLATVLHKAVNDPEAQRVRVVYANAEIPDLLQHEAQAIVTGKLAFENGEYVFYADSLQLKCPTRYSEDNPENVVDNA
jgi:cytochrome c-type biogenesis protein CcmE